MRRTSFVVAATLCAASLGGAPTIVAAQIVQNGPTVTYTPPASASSQPRIDFSRAKPMPMPAPSQVPSMSNPAPLRLPGTPGFSPGGMGTGQGAAMQLVPAKNEATIRSEMKPQLGVAPQEYGTGAGGGTPYTTSRVNAYNQPTATFQPYAATGKLFFNIGADTYVCSASLIKPGILVTAAHCVVEFGTNTFYSGWVWVPGYNNGSAPYGTWSAKSVTVMDSYRLGTDTCYQAGVICANDIALINLLVPNGLPGTQVGWYGYGWDGYGFNTSNQALINQLGYPVALDSGSFMQRTDSQGVINPTYANNTLWGSLQTGGSSGGPELVNFGRAPILSGAGFGAEAEHNVVVGVTSWGYVNTSSTGPKIQGASPFTSSNIVVMVNAVCGANPGKC